MDIASPLHLLAFGLPGPPELLLILGIALLLFGPKKLPELARAIGNSINEFKDAMSGNQRAIEEEDEEETAPEEIDLTKKIDGDDNEKAPSDD